MFSGAKINSSLSPNSYPNKLKRYKAELLAKEVYNYLIRNNYSFNKKLNTKATQAIIQQEDTLMCLLIIYMIMVFKYINQN